MWSTRNLELCLCAIIALIGCPELPDGPRYVGSGADEPLRGGTLILSEEAKVRSLDPHIAFDEVSGVLVEMLFNGLYAYDATMQLEPSVAAALPTFSEDGRTLTLELRRGVRFHHGREATAHDVVWSMERMLHPDTHSPAISYYAAIEGVDAFREGKAAHVSGLRATGRYTLEIRLREADQSFVHKLAMRFTAVLPKEIVTARGARFAAEPIGTGPFVLESWERGVRLTLRKNPYYGGSAGPYVDRVVFDEDVKRETAFLRFRNGELDIISRVAPPDVALLRTKKWQPYMALSPRADVYAIGMNAEIPPFDNVHVRRAVAFAIDRERWVKARNYSLNPTGQMLPPSVAGYDAALPNLQRFDLARAKEEMRLAGYPDGIPEPVTMWGTESATMRAYAELLQADLKKIGISVRFKLVTFPVYLEKTATRKTAQILYLGWVMDYPDASNFLELLSSKATRDTESGNRVFYTNPWLDDQLARALVEPDPKKRVAMYREANDFVAREAPWAFFANSMAPQAWQPYVKGYRPHPAYWMPVRDVWLDLPRRRIARRTSDAGPLARAAALLPFRVLP